MDVAGPRRFVSVLIDDCQSVPEPVRWDLRITDDHIRRHITVFDPVQNSKLDLLPERSFPPKAIAQAAARDYENFADGKLPANLEQYLIDKYRLDLSSTYAGLPIRNPFGKASGQLSMTAQQVSDDVAGGLGFVILKTVIAQDQTGRQSMDAWAIREARMVTEPIVGHSGESGWTVSWKGRGWWQSFGDYLQLIRDARRIAHDSGVLIVPSCKFHLPTIGESEWNAGEYEYTTRSLIAAWNQDSAGTPQPMPLEKDFSPTLAGSDRAAVKEVVIDWLRRVPEFVRMASDSPLPESFAASHPPIRIGLKLFNALFDDEFQIDMLHEIHADARHRPDFFVYGNRLFDPEREFDGHRGIAYGGPDLSDRNLRVMSEFLRRRCNSATPLLEWSATGNICSGKMAMEYALRGATSFQMHTLFQLPAEEYRLLRGNRSQKALFELLFHPDRGFIVWLHHVAERLGVDTEPVRFAEVVARARQTADFRELSR